MTTKSKDRLALEEATSKITPWSQRPAYVACVRAEIEHDRNENLRRQNKLPQQTATPDELQEWTRHTRAVLAEHGVTRPPRSLQATLSQYGARACTRCLEVLNRDTGFHSGDARCKPCAAQAGAEYREQNRDRINQRRRGAYAADPEPHRERTRQWVQDNPGYATDYRKKHQQDRPLVKKLNHGYHRAVKAGNPAERITMDQLLEHWETVGIDPARCYYTGDPLDSSNISLDHGTPISRGGGHTLDNLFPATLAANLDKGTRTVAEEFASA